MEATAPRVDMLLLNTSNYPRVPIFPYAFVQVAEVARRHGLTVKVHDLLGTAEADLLPELRRLLGVHGPRMIGIHLRQLDSLFVEEYRGYRPIDESFSPFLPVDLTVRLVALLRELCDIPIVVGGHGFTSNPAGLFERIRPDFAVTGEPDAFFARFEDVLAGRDLARVANLVHRTESRVVTNERVYFPPASNREYTLEQIDQIEKFYGARDLRSQAMPVEVMRGCPYRCYFCCEPAVKGRRAIVRDLDAVMEDVELLSFHGLGRIWFVCSELNVFGPDLALELARRITKLRERTGRTVRWFAFSLPVRMSEDVWRTLARSGFRGGFNTFQSLDDENLRRGRIPHRAEDAAREYKIIEKVAGELDDPDELRSRGTLAVFLGNSFATVETVHRSLRALHEHGILESARMPIVMAATRVFETLDPDAARDDNPRFSFGPRGEVLAEDFTRPTFEYPRALLEHFGDRRELDAFFSWVQTTILSRDHAKEKDWCLFLANATTPARLAGWISAIPKADRGGVPQRAARAAGERGRLALAEVLGDPTEPRLRALFSPPPHRRRELCEAAFGVLASLFDHSAARCAAVLEALGLGSELDAALQAPIYGVLERLYSRHESNDGAFDAVTRALGVSGDSIEALFVRAFFHERGIVIDARYRRPLFGEPGPARTPPRRSLPLAPAPPDAH